MAVDDPQPGPARDSWGGGIGSASSKARRPIACHAATSGVAGFLDGVQPPAAGARRRPDTRELGTELRKLRNERGGTVTQVAIGFPPF
jgi:hypothetical protein